MNEDLPSINDFVEDRSELPSVNEGVETELPSYKDFLEERVEEVVADIDDQYSHHFEQAQPAPPVVVQTDLSSVITLIEGVRNSIPEVKSYDKELYELMSLIEELRREIPEIPEFPDVKYYDKEIQELKESIPTIPEVKYYDEDIKELKESINEVKDRYIPDFRWIYKSFNQLDEGQETLTDSVGTLKEKLEMQVTDLIESIEVTKFESSVDFKEVKESVSNSKKELIETIEEAKKNIYKEMRDSSLKIWNLNKEYKNEDKKLREETLNQYQQLKENLDTTIDGIVKKTDKDYIEVSEYFNSLKKEVENLPKVKYYDEEIKKVNESVKNVQSLVEVLESKLNQKIEDVKEGLLNIPPSEDNSDPLTPLDQNFVTIDELQSHYKLFVNRVQQQLATFGGGGEVQLQYLDDVDRDSVMVEGNMLIYSASEGKWVGIASTGITPGDAGINEVLEIGDTSPLGMSVGFVTATGASFSGNVTIGGTLIYDDVRNVDSIGLITARDGIHATGVVTATAFHGSGSSLTGVLTTYSGIVTDARATEGQILQHNGTEIVGVSSVGLGTYFNDQQQGYYRYSTHYYSSGIANTVQTLPADTFVLVQPAVRSNKTQFMPQVMLDANGGDPWVGSGATIGTGQTEFSLAGLDAGSSVIVRIAAQFDPDIDNTNVDFALNFTTNPATQAAGTTNFSVTREQALICNEGADQPYIGETLINFYLGSSLAGLTTTDAGSFNVTVRASDEGDLEMMALTINVVT